VTFNSPPAAFFCSCKSSENFSKHASRRLCAPGAGLTGSAWAQAYVVHSMTKNTGTSSLYFDFMGLLGEVGLVVFQQLHNGPRRIDLCQLCQQFFWQSVR